MLPVCSQALPEKAIPLQRIRNGMGPLEAVRGREHLFKQTIDDGFVAAGLVGETLHARAETRGQGGP